VTYEYTRSCISAFRLSFHFNVYGFGLQDLVSYAAELRGIEPGEIKIKGHIDAVNLENHKDRRRRRQGIGTAADARRDDRNDHDSFA